MLDYIWAGMMLISVVFGCLNGRMAAISDAFFSGSASAITVCIALLGSMCLWSGLMRIAEQAGFTKILGKILKPFTRLAFPGLDPDGEAARAISMNISANMLGLGNAATPFGIEAMKQLNKLSRSPGTATNHMITFVVINTASLQIIPTTIAMLRTKYGSANPMDIMLPMWLAALSALAVGLTIALCLGRVRRE